MGTILSVMRGYQAVKANMDAIIVDAITSTKQDLLNYQAEQLHKGSTSEGSNFPAYKNSLYAELKHGQNPLPGLGNPDLFLTGAFYRGLKAEVTTDTVKIFSTDSKAETLEKKYGADYIYGLSPKFRNEYINQVLRKAFFQNIKKVLANP